eukprot:GSChrysophyteH2.ASY1.ANO1.1338.1 assembled CDS
MATPVTTKIRTKEVFSSLDMMAMVNELHTSAVGARIVNVYDIDTRTYLLKLTMPGSSENDMPSVFAMKLRKYLKNKRLDSAQQLGMDRVCDLRFGSGVDCNHLIVELYSLGNIILTDHTYCVLSLLRTHKFENDVTCQVGDPYPIAFATSQYLVDQAAKLNNKGSRKKPKRMFIKQLLLSKEYESGVCSLGPDLIDHCIACCGEPWAKNTAVHSVNSLRSFSDDSVISSFITRLADGVARFQELKDNDTQRYLDFTPVLLAQHENKSTIRFNTFAETVDEYFCKIEEQRLVRAAALMEEQAHKKIEKVKAGRAEQIAGIEDDESKLAAQASLVETYAEDIDKLAMVLNSAMENGLSWDEIQIMVDEETDNGNPIAAMVASLNLEKHRVTVKLRDTDSDDIEDSDGEDVDLTLSAHANASNLFKRRKLLSAHFEKATKASEQAVNAVEGTVLRQLEAHKMRVSLKEKRTSHWFEKFSWFITTEGYLVISGRSDHQTETVFRKYMRPDDVCVFADIPGAQPCVLRRKTKDKSISPYAIHETGNLCVCRSVAWNKKSAASPWWVWGAQVIASKETTGKGYTIHGKKNFLPPMRMELGFGVLFVVDEASALRHANDRKTKGVFDDTMSVVSDAADQRIDVANERKNEEKNRKAKKNGKQDHRNEKMESAPPRAPMEKSTAAPRRKKVDKKKSRRYAEQDDEDRDLAMQALGHAGKGGTLKDRAAVRDNEAREIDESHRRDQAGLTDYLSKRQTSVLNNMDATVSARINTLVAFELLRASDLDIEELDTLVKLSAEAALQVLASFEDRLTQLRDEIGMEFDGAFGKKKSAILAGIMLRAREDRDLNQSSKVSVVDTTTGADAADVDADVGASDIDTHIIDDTKDEDIDLELESDELSTMDDVSHIVAFPTEDDILLYCIPCCGPYSAIQGFKYRVKLTPGTMKQGQVAKTVLDLFGKGSSWISAAERTVMLGLSTEEVVPTLVRNTKINMPGLHIAKKGAMSGSKGKKSGKNVRGGSKGGSGGR